MVPTTAAAAAAMASSAAAPPPPTQLVPPPAAPIPAMTLPVGLSMGMAAAMPGLLLHPGYTFVEVFAAHSRLVDAQTLARLLSPQRQPVMDVAKVVTLLVNRNNELVRTIKGNQKSKSKEVVESNLLLLREFYLNIQAIVAIDKNYTIHLLTD
eukprot:TRINITY_DN3423_c0_g1_i2.p1 TRINITY_DN3423_c0_g1~~TRINITY_DN3423_c0_g1_i2.p1  ORF type:complete len:178 (-),score=81.79 TRINITY_DN3423_c0_g1_i2:136-594(-)